MIIKVIGSGCSRCKTLEKNVKLAVSELMIDAEVRKVEDIQEIISHGILSTPALLIDGRIIFSGKVPDLHELKEIILKNQ